MIELSGKNLQDYISHIRDLECSCYKQRQYINRLNGLLDSAKRPQLYAQKAHKTAKGAHPDIIPVTMGFCGSIGIFIAIIVLYKTEGLLSAIFGGPVAGGLIGGIAGAVLGAIISAFSSHAEKKTLRKENEKLDEENVQIRQENVQILTQARKRGELIQAELVNARQTYNKTRELLDKYYNAGIIYEKYRSLVPITMFCEYFASGRCTSLTGHEGAYNIYENEIRLNLIITKLDDIITRLDQIQQNQYMLAQMIKESNRAIQTLTASVSQQTKTLQSIEHNTAVSAYYNQITATNTSYLAWLAYIER